MNAIKHDQSKSRWHLFPFDALEEVARVLEFGANKYGERNWESGMPWGRLVSALLRHISAFMMGEDNDRESGLSHLAHAACNCLFLLSYFLRNKGIDDRSEYDND